MSSKPKNKLYCKGYFCSRLTDNGFAITKLNIPYEKDDLRRWSIIVNSKERMILQENVKNSFGKKLSRRGTVYYGKR